MGASGKTGLSRQTFAVVMAAFAFNYIPSLTAQPAEPGQAEPERQGRGGAIEEVVVTARRVEESLQDSPVSVAAFSQSQLEYLGASEPGDVERYTPNLTMRKSVGSSDNYSMAIRGMAGLEVALTSESAVGVYVDDVYIARNAGMAFEIVDMKRIEVLRGPQGTLFGRNTVGGAINIISEKPRGEWGLKQQVRVGNRGHRRLHTTLDTPRVGNLAAKLSFLHAERDGLVKSIHTGEEIGQFENLGARAALNWNPVDSFQVDYAFDISRRDSHPQISQLSHVRPFYSDPDGDFYGGAYYEKAAAQASSGRLGQLAIRSDGSFTSFSDIDSHVLTVEWEVLPTMTVKSISSFRDWHSVDRADFGTFGAPADGSLCRSANPGDYDFVTGTCLNPVPEGELVSMFESVFIDSAQEQRTQEIQFIGTLFEERLNYTAGLYYFEEEGREINPQRLVLPAPFAAAALSEALIPQNRGNSLVIDLPHFRYRTDNKAYAVYGDFTYAVLARFDVSLGFRYSVDDKKTMLTNTLDATIVNPAGVLKTVTADDDWSNFNPSLTLNYRWSEQLNTYGKVVTGYRAGGHKVRVASTDSFQDPIDEENVVSYEIGWKSDLFDRSVRFNGAIFYADYTDQQINSLEAGPGGAVQDTLNAGEAVHSGLELEAIWQVSPALRLSGSYGYLDVDFDEFLASRLDPATGFSTNPGELEDISDVAKPLFAPENSASLQVEYRIAQGAWGQLSLQADASFTDTVYFLNSQLNEFDAQSPHTLFNGRLTLSEIPLGRDGDLRVSLWGKNLSDKAYREYGADFGIVGFATNSYGELRSYGLDIVYEYNR